MDSRSFESFLVDQQPELKEVPLAPSVGDEVDKKSANKKLVIQLSTPLNELKKEDVKKVLENIGRMAQYTDIEIEELETAAPKKKSGKKKSSTTEGSFFTKQIKAIALRNHLVQYLNIEIEHLPRPIKSIDIWAALFSVIMHYFVDPATVSKHGMPSIIFNQSAPAVVMSKDVQNHREVHKCIDEMEKIGFEKFCEFLLYKKPYISQKKLVIDYFDKPSGFNLSCLDVLESFNELQQQDEYKNQQLSFTDIVFRCERVFTHTKAFYDATLTFLDKNRNIRYFDIGQQRDHVVPEDTKICLDFYNEYKGKGTQITRPITAHFKLPYISGLKLFDDFSIEISAEESKGDLESTEEKISERYDQLTTVSKKMPDSWWKPLPSTKKKKQALIVYEQELTVENQAVVTAEASAQIEIKRQIDVGIDSTHSLHLSELLYEEDVLERKLGRTYNYFRAIVGSSHFEKLGKIDCFTPEACAEIECYPTGFLEGLVYDPRDPKKNMLPKGFGILEKDSKRILYFDATLAAVPKTEEGLRPYFNQGKNLIGHICEGSIGLFINDLTEEKEKPRIQLAFERFIERSRRHRERGVALELYQEDIFVLLAALSKQKTATVQNHFKEYKDIFATFTQHNFDAMREIVLKGQSKGLEIFLKNCRALKQAGLFDVFKACFIEDSVHLIVLNSTESIDLIKRLVEIGNQHPNLGALWNTIFLSHSKAVKDHDLFFESKMKAFLAFCDELQKMGLDLDKLPMFNNLQPVISIHTTLNHILDILRSNPKRAYEQLANFKGLERGNDFAHYAVVVDKYSFVIPEMDLQPDKSVDAKKLTYFVDDVDLRGLANVIDKKSATVSEKKTIESERLLEECKGDTISPLDIALARYKDVLDIFEFENEDQIQQFYTALKKLPDPAKFFEDFSELNNNHVKFSFEEGMVLVARRSKNQFFTDEDRIWKTTDDDNTKVTRVTIFQSLIYDLNHGQGHLQNYLVDLLYYAKKVDELGINLIDLAYCMRFVNHKDLAKYEGEKVIKFVASINHAKIFPAMKDALKELASIPRYGRILADNLSPQVFLELFDALKRLKVDDHAILVEKAKNFLTYKATVIYFYRYLGSTHTPLPIQSIRKIVNIIEDNLPLRNDYDAKALLLPLIAPALQGASSPYIKNEKYCNLICSALAESKARKETVQNLQSFSDKKINYNLRDLAGLMQYQKEHKGPVEWKKIHELGPVAYSAFVNLGFRSDAKTLSEYKFDEHKIIELINLHEVLQAHQDSIFSALSLLDFGTKATEVEGIILAFKTLAEKSPVLLNRLLSVINKINAESSRAFPSPVLIDQLISHLEENSSLSVDGACQWISDKLPNVKFDDILSGQPFTEDDFRKEVNEVRVTTIESLTNLFHKPPLSLRSAVAALKGWAQTDDDTTLVDDANSVLRKLNAEVSTAEQLLALFDNMVEDIDSKFYARLPSAIKTMLDWFGKGKISPIIFKYVYNPYDKTKEICIKKLSEDFKQLIPNQKKHATFDAQIKAEFSKADLKDKAKRTDFSGRYNLYKEIASILQQNKHQAKQPEFCAQFFDVLLATKDDKKPLLELVHTILNQKFSFETKAFIFLSYSQTRDLKKTHALAAHFGKIYAIAPACVSALQSKIREEKGDASIYNFIGDFDTLIEALPGADHLSILNILLKFSNTDRLNLLTVLNGIQGPSLKRLVLHFLNNMLLRDAEITQSIDDVIKWMGLLIKAVGSRDEDKKVEASGDIYQQFKNINCPGLQLFKQKLEEGVALKTIFDEIDANPLGNRDSKAEREIKPDEIERLLKIKFSYIKPGAIESIRKNFETINSLDYSTLPRDVLEKKLKEAMEHYKKNRGKEDNAIVPLLACLREWMYRTPPHRFPNAMQILSILTSFELGRFTLLGIRTGQGKSIVCALQAAVIFSLGHSAVILTSNHSLAKRDYLENEQFFASLGAEKAYIDKDSIKGTFKRGGINYATTGDFSLYWQAAKKRGESLRGPKGNKITMSAAIDEEDDLILTKSGSDQFISTRKVEGLGDHAWMYEHINKFADFCAEKKAYLGTDEKEGPDPDCQAIAGAYREMARTHADAINNGMQSVYGKECKFDVEHDDHEITALEVHTLHKYLLDKATPKQKAMLERPGFLVLLKTLIDSAKTVREDIFPTWIRDEKGRESNGFQVVTKHVVRGEKICDERHIEIVHGGRPKKGYRFSNGDHQLLTKRVENALKDEGGAPFVYDPLSSPVSIRSADTLLREFQKHPEALVIGSSGSPGSQKQIKEKMERYNFITAEHPPQEEKETTEPPPKFTKTNEEQVNEVIEQILAHRKSPDKAPTAILVLTQNSEKIANLKEVLNKKLAELKLPAHVHVLNAKNEEEESEVLEKVPFGVAISTMSGRGSDIKMTTDGGQLIHPKGLKVIQMDVVSTTEKQQAKGRTNRRGVGGIYQEVFDMAEIQTQHPEYFPTNIPVGDLSNDQCETIIANIRQSMDAQSEFRRNQTIIYHQVVLALEKPFNKFGKEFERQRGACVEANNSKNAVKWEEALASLEVAEQAALAHLAAYWEELPNSLAREVPQEELEKEWSATRRMNYMHDRLKTYAVSLWGQFYQDLNKQWQSIHRELDAKGEAPPLPRNIQNYDLLSALIEIRGRHEVGVEKIPPTYKDKKTGDISPDAMAKQLKDAIDQYEQKRWFVSSDRTTEKNRFFKAIPTNNITFTQVLKELNESYRRSLSKDIDYAKSGWWRAYYYFTFRGGERSTSSRYREILLAKKKENLKNCPAGELIPVIRAELEHIAKVLEIEAGRPIYTNTRLADILAQINALKNRINQGLEGPISNDNLIILLTNTVPALSSILKGFDHHKLSSLKELDDQSLSTLLQYYQYTQNETDLKKGAIAIKIADAARKITFPVVNSTRTERYGFFWLQKRTHVTFNNYQEDARLVSYLAGMDNASKFYCHGILKQLYDKLMTDFSAIDIEIKTISSSAAKNPEFQLVFRTVDRAGTGQTDIHQFNLAIDFQLKTVSCSSFSSRAKEEVSLRRLAEKRLTL